MYPYPDEFPVFRAPRLFSQVPGVVCAESTRHGGVSTGPYTSLNLGKSTADHPDAIAENRRRFFAAFSADENDLAFAGQVHGASVWKAEKAGFAGIGFDALITNQHGIWVGVTVADCAPVLVFDPVSRAVAAIHAGWRGTAAGVVQHTLIAMQQHYNTQAHNCIAYVGVCIDAANFEVGDEVAVQFSADYKFFDPNRGKFCVDLKKANAAQLLSAGVKPENIEISPYSTAIHRSDYFSHRFDGGITGRMLAVIGMR